ncbi:MAG: sodium:solute symporter family protein [Candidatus Adiutrix sp.]|jgi:Na+/proline symporter|nr:sodium:solute symporter family protein [Candidatus Adiutrix sp.]
MLSFAELWVTIVLYIFFILGIGGFINHQRSKNPGASLFASKLPWFQAVMTYIASLMSVWVFFAGPAGYYKGGFTYWISEMIWLPVFALSAHFITNRIWALSRKRQYITPADSFCDRFQGPGSKVLRGLVGLVMLISAFPYITSVIAAIAHGGIRVSDGSISYASISLTLGISMVLFTAIGGFKSVALTDTIQGVLFFCVLWLISLVVVFYMYDGSYFKAFKEVYNTDDGVFFSYPGPNKWESYGYRFGYPFALIIGYSVMLPHIFVRACYASRDLKAQRKLTTWTPVVRFLVWGACFVIGLVCFGALPGLDGKSAEYVIPYLIEGAVFPNNPIFAHVLMILFFCGACGVGISTADSYLLSAASIVADDFIIGIFGVKLTHKTRTLVGRITIFVIGLAGVIMAINPPGLIVDLIMFSIGITMPLWPVLVMGIWWKKATTPAAVAAIIAGMIGIWIQYMVLKNGGTYYGALGMLFSFIAMIFVSLITYKPGQENKKYHADMVAGLNELYIVDPAAK